MTKNDKVRKPQDPSSSHTWAIRGIDYETRIAATKAARRDGKTVGEWCNHVLRGAAIERLKDKLPTQTIEDTLSKLVDVIGSQSARLEALERAQEREKRTWFGFIIPSRLSRP
jgi:hypothetical protein